MRILKVWVEINATCKCLSHHQLHVVFACNAKSFAIAVLVISFLLLFFFVTVFGWDDNNFFLYFCILLKVPVTSIRFDNVCCLLSSHVRWTDKQQWQIKERACGLFFVNHWKYISITTLPVATRLSRVVTYHDGLPLIKSHDPLITWSCKITRQT